MRCDTSAQPCWPSTPNAASEINFIPAGALDESTYPHHRRCSTVRSLRKSRGATAREPYWTSACSSCEAEKLGHRDSPADEGATRALLEGHFLFGPGGSLDGLRLTYKLLILPDEIQIDADLATKLTPI